MWENYRQADKRTDRQIDVGRKYICRSEHIHLMLEFSCIKWLCIIRAKNGSFLFLFWSNFAYTVLMLKSTLHKSDGVNNLKWSFEPLNAFGTCIFHLDIDKQLWNLICTYHSMFIYACNNLRLLVVVYTI